MTTSIKLSEIIPPHFYALHKDIKAHNHTEYILPGGRGSCKSSFISEEIPLIIKRNPKIHGLILRKVGNTLKDSVFNQIVWAIETLGLSKEFKATFSPMQITYKPTGQTIYFKGLDDPLKAKSIKPPFGYIGILWFEELDQFNGPEEIRSVEQSAKRGGDKYFVFKSFNPPISVNNWTNKYVLDDNKKRIVVRSNYLSVPVCWLGQEFFDDAEHLKAQNERAYRHEYLGEAVGTGGNVFENVTIRPITDEEIKQFDNVVNGLDFGYYPDPWAFNKCFFKNNRLYIFEEDRRVKQTNRQTFDILVNEHNITSNDLIICDSAEPKSIADYKAFGLFVRGADKTGPSRKYSYKWLQSLDEIIIDNKRCPHTADEFLSYEYQREKDGTILDGYPDGMDHNIDAVRYATNRLWRRKGV